MGSVGGLFCSGTWRQPRSQAAQRDIMGSRQGTGNQETSCTPDFALGCLCNLQSLISLSELRFPC